MPDDQAAYEDALRRGTFVVWMTCDCTVWPIDPTAPVGWCGFCGERPRGYVDAPPTGMATPLELYRRFTEGDPDA